VVEAGANTGVAMAALLTPVVGVQLKLVALVVTVGVKEFPKQILVPAMGSSVKVLVKLMVMEVVVVQVVAGLRVTTL
jgi:hypothetical protein